MCTIGCFVHTGLFLGVFFGFKGGKGETWGGGGGGGVGGRQARGGVGGRLFNGWLADWSYETSKSKVANQGQEAVERLAAGPKTRLKVRAFFFFSSGPWGLCEWAERRSVERLYILRKSCPFFFLFGGFYFVVPMGILPMGNPGQLFAQRKPAATESRYPPPPPPTLISY